MQMDLTRRQLACAGLAAGAGLRTGWPGRVSAQDQTTLPVSTTDPAGRSVVPVTLAGRGPYRFVIDTAATASVIARDLIAPLNLTPRGNLVMNTVLGPEIAPYVIAEDLISGNLKPQTARLVVGRRDGLIGMDGLIGLDLLAGQRLVFRTRGRGQASIQRSRRDDDAFLGPVRPRIRFPALSPDDPVRLIVVEAIVQGFRVPALLDTGAETSLINTALASLAAARPLAADEASVSQWVQSPTGRRAAARPVTVRNVRFDALALSRLGLLAGDFPIFETLGYGRLPAMLLGMDVLGLFHRVVVDLRRGEIILDI